LERRRTFGVNAEARQAVPAIAPGCGRRRSGPSRVERFCGCEWRQRSWGVPRLLRSPLLRRAWVSWSRSGPRFAVFRSACR